MKAKKFQISLILVMASLFANSIPVFAYPAEPPDKTPIPRASTASPCALMAARAASMDIPSSRADYAIFDQLTECGVVAGSSIILVTGSRPDLGKQRYEDFKSLQAELMSE